jgi:hypothetical protein
MSALCHPRGSHGPQSPLTARGGPMEWARRVLVRWILFAVIGTACAACSVLNMPFDFDDTTFLWEKQQWTAGNHRDYSYTCVSDGTGGATYRITVRNGVFIGSEPEMGWQDWSLRRTIDAVYEDLEGMYESAKDKIVPDWDWYLMGIEVSYDAQLHFPDHVLYRYHFPAGWDPGFGTEYRISDLTME